MKAVLDASAALNVVSKGEFYDLISQSLEMCDITYAPTLFYAEVGNALLRAVRAGVLNFSQSAERYDDALGLVGKFEKVELYSHAVFHEAHRLNHSIYDIYYLELAKQKGAHLITLDQKLISLAQENELRYMQFEDVSDSFFLESDYLSRIYQ